MTRAAALAVLILFSSTLAAQRPSDPALLIPETAPQLDYVAVANPITLPEGTKMGASAAVAFDARGSCLVHDDVREHVRHMARHRDEPVVRGGVDRDGDGAELRREPVHEPVPLGIGLRGRRQEPRRRDEDVRVRVLGASFTGAGSVLLAGLRYAIEQGFDVINMSLSTTKKPFAGVLHELADSAYFKRTVLVASAHNMPVESYPWRFSSVISVGSHEDPDPLAYFYNPSPPVEFFGRGVNVEVPWQGGRTLTVSGNSFATPHLSAICALVLAKHPELTPFQLKSVLYLTASNVGGGA